MIGTSVRRRERPAENSGRTSKGGMVPNSSQNSTINQQINTEFYSAYLYLNFSNYFEEVGLDGFANWYKIQAQEERDHAMLFYQYLQNENQKVTFEAIDKPDLNAACHMDVLKAGLEHEKYVTSLINDIYSEAYEAKDFRTMQFLDCFVKEQGEEETNAKNLISKIELFGSDPKSLYMLNQELAARVYGNGLRLVLQNLSKHILVFETPEAARKKLGKKKPMLWVVTEALTKQPDQPWRADKRTPVILLSNQPESEITIEKNTGKVIILPVPVLPETLRNAVKTYLLIKEGK